MRRLNLVALALVLGLAPAVAATARPEPSGDVKDEAARDIDTLYARLAKTRFPDEAAGVVGEIAHLRSQSGSDTADLLLGRAHQAREAENLSLALQLFDAVVDVDPDWSEAWSQRATARLESGDLPGAMSDVAQTLKRNPRDLDALAELAALLLDAGDAEAALKVYDRALKLAPAYEPLKEARTRAQTKLWSLSP